VLIEATIMVARSLGMGTVAEGIETEEQAAALARMHCDKGQGYLFSKPLATDEMTRWLRERDAAQQRPQPSIVPAQQSLAPTPCPLCAQPALAPTPLIDR